MLMLLFGIWALATGTLKITKEYGLEGTAARVGGIMGILAQSDHRFWNIPIT